jgi:CubicO group peptidase (beta-lactamase class C family)
MQNAAKCKILLFFTAVFFASCDRNKDPFSSATMQRGGTRRAEILAELVSQIENNRYGEVHGLVISIGDSIVFEKYFNGYYRERKHALYSVTKSFTSALVGICHGQGYIDSTRMRVLGFFPEYAGRIANGGPMKENITVEHCLTMTSGFLWDEWSTSYNDPDNDVVKLSQSSDWIKHVLDLPMDRPPGTAAKYNSGVSHLLSAIITKATGKSARDFARDNLFAYLGIGDWNWENRPDGVSIGGWGLSLRPVDMVKFGQLYLKKGRWNGRQVVPEDWVEQSIKPYHRINGWCDYGYQWWRYGQPMVDAGLLKSTDIFFAAGRGEQFIWVIPFRQAVVVCTAWNDGQAKLERALWEYILKALDD